MRAIHAIQFAGSLGSFCARHFVATCLTVVSACVLWTVIYFVLLVWAVLTNSGLGGPLAYPAGLLFFLIAGTAAGLFLLFPAAAIAECVTRLARLPILLQIPLCLITLAVLCPAAALVLSALNTEVTMEGVVTGGGILFLTLLVPMGLYWWTAQSLPLLLSLLGCLRHIPRLLPIRRTNDLAPVRIQ